MESFEQLRNSVPGTVEYDDTLSAFDHLSPAAFTMVFWYILSDPFPGGGHGDVFARGAVGRQPPRSRSGRNYF